MPPPPADRKVSPMTTPFVLDVDDAGFERDVMERSRSTPVVVDFWAPWCAPCRTLGPVLERLAEEHAGAFVLARVDVDANPRLAEAFAVRSIPAVKAIRGGEVVAAFEGALPEGRLRLFLEKVLPSAADALTQEGARFAAGGHRNAAEERFRAALATDPRHAGALLGLAGVLAEGGHANEALELLERILPGVPEHAEAERLAAALRTKGAGTAYDEAALRARLAAQEDDLDARLDLGLGLAAAGRHEEALEMLLDVVRRNAHFRDDAARRAMVDLFAVLGAESPLTQRYRGALARALFR